MISLPKTRFELPTDIAPFHFPKIRGHTRFHMRSKQNNESDSAEILTVAIYENVLHGSESLFRYWHDRTVRLSTYWTAHISMASQPLRPFCTLVLTSTCSSIQTVSQNKLPLKLTRLSPTPTFSLPTFPLAASASFSLHLMKVPSSIFSISLHSAAVCRHVSGTCCSFFPFLDHF